MVLSSSLKNLPTYQQNMEDKNSKDNNGTSPLHNAAYQSQFQISQNIIEIWRIKIPKIMREDKNPRNIIEQGVRTCSKQTADFTFSCLTIFQNIEKYCVLCYKSRLAVSLKLPNILLEW